MQQALQRSNLVPSGFVVESAYFEGNKSVIAVRASGSVGLCPSCGTVSRLVHIRDVRGFAACLSAATSSPQGNCRGVRARAGRDVLLLSCQLTAGRLTVVDPLPERRRRAARIGADRVVAPAEVADSVNELSNGRGVDMFIETSGTPAALQTAIVNTATLGTVAVAAWYGTRPLHLSLSPEFHLRSLKIISIHVANLDEGDGWDRARKFDTSLDFLARVNVGEVITHRMPFRRAPSAYELLDKNSADTLGVLLDY